MRRAVKIITIEITTSVAESIPSPTTAKLPANKPIMILDTDKIALPIVLIHEVVISCIIYRWSIKNRTINLLNS